MHSAEPCAALTLGLRGGGSLLALLVLPLYVPVLIFGAGSVDAVRAGLSASPHLSLLAVSPTYQRRGIARRLIAWLLDSATVAGTSSIHVELRDRQSK